MRKLIATTALALIIGGPAVAQDQATQDQQAGQDQQQLTAQDQQQVGQDQQMMAQQGFYQPQQNDLLISSLMDAQVYAPQARDAQMQQEGQLQEQPAEQDAAVTTDPAADPAATEQDTAAAADPAATDQEDVTVEVEVDPEAEAAEAEVVDDPAAEQQDQQVVTEDPAAEQQDQQVATDDPAMQQQDQQVATQDPAMQQTQVGTAQTMTQDQLDQMENIGQVTDVIVGEQGEVRAVVVEVGGFLGIGAREVALSMDEIDFARDQQDPNQIHVITRAGANELEQAPEFDRAMMQQAAADQQVATDAEQPAQDQQVVVTDTEQPAEDQQVVTDTEQPAEDQQVAQQDPAQPQQQDWRGDRQTLAAPQMQREGFQQAQAGEYSADDLIGANVYDVNDDNIGSVSDVVLGAEGAAEYAVIDVGGFLGFGTHTVAIGFDEMQVLHDEGWADLRVYVDVTQEQLEQMPEYQAN